MSSYQCRIVDLRLSYDRLIPTRGFPVVVSYHFTLNLSPRTNAWSAVTIYTQIAKPMGPTWGPTGSCRPKMGPMMAPWTLLSGYVYIWDLILLIATDALPQISSWASLPEKLHIFSPKFLWIPMIPFQLCCPYDVIQNGLRDTCIAKPRGNLSANWSGGRRPICETPQLSWSHRGINGTSGY